IDEDAGMLPFTPKANKLRGMPIIEQGSPRSWPNGSSVSSSFLEFSRSVLKFGSLLVLKNALRRIPFPRDSTLFTKHDGITDRSTNDSRGPPTANCAPTVENRWSGAEEKFDLRLRISSPYELGSIGSAYHRRRAWMNSSGHLCAVDYGPDLHQYWDFGNIQNMEQHIGSISSLAAQPASPISAFEITRRRLKVAPPSAPPSRAEAASIRLGPLRTTAHRRTPKLSLAEAPFGLVGDDNGPGSEPPPRNRIGIATAFVPSRRRSPAAPGKPSFP
ncbi:hypothetical protein THAOC_31019, partial [Thalassiosira oceanica]